MVKRRSVLLTILILILVGGFSYGYYIWNKPARNVAKEEGIRITAPAIYDSFTNNEQSANTYFLNKVIEVTGTVTAVKKNQAGETVIYLQSSDPVFGVNCTFKQYPGMIDKGSAVTFKGICTGYLSDVILNEGIIVK